MKMETGQFYKAPSADGSEGSDGEKLKFDIGGSSQDDFKIEDPIEPEKIEE